MSSSLFKHWNKRKPFFVFSLYIICYKKWFGFVIFPLFETENTKVEKIHWLELPPLMDVKRTPNKFRIWTNAITGVLTLYTKSWTSTPKVSTRTLAYPFAAWKWNTGHFRLANEDSCIFIRICFCHIAFCCVVCIHGINWEGVLPPRLFFVPFKVWLCSL